MNVIWIVSDTLRRDHIGVYGNKFIHTPSIDALAAKSVRFDRYYAASFPTMPTRADYMTGRWTVAYMQWEPLYKGEVTLAEILTRDRINTAAIVDTPFFIRNEMNYDRGFITCEEMDCQLKGMRRTPFGELATSLMEEQCCAPKTFTAAMKWLELNYKDNFFLYVDTWDPHEPWNAPFYYTEMYWPDYDGESLSVGMGHLENSPGMTEEKLKKAHATYCGEVTMVDTWVGNLLHQVKHMGLMDNTAIIFTTDHGTYFNEHDGRYGKIAFTGRGDPATGKMPALGRTPHYEEIIAIPLLIYMPGIKPGSYNGLTSAIDLMPTVLDIMGQEIPATVEGRSLVPKLKDTSLPGYEQVFTSFSFMNKGDMNVCADGPLRNVDYDSMATITTDEWSLVYDPNPGMSELYNLKNDPVQTRDLISQHPDVAHQLHQLFVNHMYDKNINRRFIEKRLELQL